MNHAVSRRQPRHPMNGPGSQAVVFPRTGVSDTDAAPEARNATPFHQLGHGLTDRLEAGREPGTEPWAARAGKAEAAVPGPARRGATPGDDALRTYPLHHMRAARLHGGSASMAVCPSMRTPIPPLVALTKSTHRSGGGDGDGALRRSGATVLVCPGALRASSQHVQSTPIGHAVAPGAFLPRPRNPVARAADRRCQRRRAAVCGLSTAPKSEVTSTARPHVFQSASAIEKDGWHGFGYMSVDPDSLDEGNQNNPRSVSSGSSRGCNEGPAVIVAPKAAHKGQSANTEGARITRFAGRCESQELEETRQ